MDEVCWMVVICESESRAESLLGELRGAGIDPESSTIVRVETPEMRRLPAAPRLENRPRQLDSRQKTDWSLIFACLLGMMIGILSGLLPVPKVASLALYAIGAAITVLLFRLLPWRQGRAATAASPPTLTATHECLVAVRVRRSQADRAERLARNLGAREVMVG